MDMSKIEIRTLMPEGWLTYKSVRLPSLMDSPDSFGSTYEREASFPDPEWRSRLELSRRAKYALPLIANSFLNHIAAWAGAKNCEFVALSVTATNEEPVCLYRMLDTP